MREKNNRISASEKYVLTIGEAAQYFSIGVKQLRRIAEENKGSFAIYMGNRYLIIRTRFEEYMNLLAEQEEENNEDTSVR